MRLPPWAMALFVVLCSSTPYSASGAEGGADGHDPCATETFHHGRMSADSIFNEYAGAVLRLEVMRGGDDNKPVLGTGYVVDSERGYVLTALHVVEAAFDPSQRSAVIIQATSPAAPGVMIALEPVAKSDAPNDAALLKASDPTNLAGIHPLDIALRMLPIGTRYFTIGYPRGKITPDFQEAQWMGRDDQRMEVRHYVYGGSSGSPLIDENGAVVATCLEDVNDLVALYEPLVEVQDLLDKIPESLRVDVLDRRVRNAGAPEQTRLALTEQLRWRAGNPSNLDLYAWAKRIASNPSAYEGARALFMCPIVRAYVDRRLEVALSVRAISGLVAPERRATVLMGSADKALALGRPREALEPAREAASEYRRAQDSSGEVRALSLVADAEQRIAILERKLDATYSALSAGKLQAPTWFPFVEGYGLVIDGQLWWGAGPGVEILRPASVLLEELSLSFDVGWIMWRPTVEYSTLPGRPPGTVLQENSLTYAGAMLKYHWPVARPIHLFVGAGGGGLMQPEYGWRLGWKVAACTGVATYLFNTRVAFELRYGLYDLARRDVQFDSFGEATIRYPQSWVGGFSFGFLISRALKPL